jgi:BirA family transcriptional regulator, biotin operon repressor / biotin---[acetyl-CoA-carboxylase] ligase
MAPTKYRLLACLKVNPGRWISGESISAQLGISRTAVWKQINSLRSDGHEIQSAPKKGYRLEKAADILAAEEISSGLKTRIMGRPSIVVFKQTDSTNQQAKLLAGKGAPEGTVVLAESQTSGRGRRGRTWLSPAGQGLCLSIILRPPLTPAQAPQITLMTAVAVARTLANAGIQANIKWPNDILVEDRKIAGILTEISTEMDQVDWVIVGLGLNVNTPARQIPPDIRGQATSIWIQKGHGLSRTELLVDLLQDFEACYEQLKTGGFGPIMAQWRRMSDIIGRQVYVDVMGTRYCGTVAAVDDDGVLILKDTDGQIRRIFSGDVTRVQSQSPGRE